MTTCGPPLSWYHLEFCDLSRTWSDSNATHEQLSCGSPRLALCLLVFFCAAAATRIGSVTIALQLPGNDGRYTSSVCKQSLLLSASFSHSTWGRQSVGHLLDAERFPPVRRTARRPQCQVTPPITVVLGTHCFRRRRSQRRRHQASLRQPQVLR